MKAITTKYVTILALALASILNAETVYLSQHGKTYHKTKTCMALARATKVLEGSDEDAKAHGLHACGICYRVKKEGTKPKAGDNGSWAK